MKNSTIYYIHGFGSSSLSSTGQGLIEKYNNVKVLEYDSALSFSININYLISQLNEDDTDRLFIGSSLGGYYATILSECSKKYSTAILINPSIDPKESLKKYLGDCTYYHSNKLFTLTEETVNSYISLKYNEKPTMVLLAKNDEVIDYRIAELFYSNNAAIRYIKGGHRLEDISILDKYISEHYNTIIDY